MEALASVPGTGLLNYETLYALAFGTAILIATRRALRMGWPLYEWCTLMAACVFGAVVGSKLLLLSPVEWPRFLMGQYPHHVGRTFLGGAAGAVLAALAVRHLFGMRRPIADAFVWALPVGAIIGRVGCLITGCCFGAPSSGPLAIAYPAGAPVFRHQVSNGWIEADALQSLHVHPMPVYEIGFWLLILLAIWSVGNRLRASGSLLSLSIILYGVLRFIGEFYRGASPAEGGLSTFQTGLLVAVPLLLIHLIVREVRFRPANRMRPSDAPVWKPLLIISIVTAGTAVLAVQFTAGERLAMLGIVIAAGLVTAFNAYPRHRLRTVLATPPIVAILSLLVVASGHVAAPDTTITYDSFSLEGAWGRYDHSELRGYDYRNYEGCDGDMYQEREPIFEMMEHTYSIADVKWMRVRRQRESRRSIGVQGYAGSETRSPSMYSPNGDTRMLIGVHPFLQQDWTWVGIGGGFHVGQLGGPANGLPERESDYRGRIVWPSAYLRIFPEDVFFMDLRFGEGIGGFLDPHQVEMGLGRGFSTAGIPGSIRLGASLPTTRGGKGSAALYLSTDIPFTRNVGLNGSFVISEGALLGGRVGLSYRVIHGSGARRPPL